MREGAIASASELSIPAHVDAVAITKRSRIKSSGRSRRGPHVRRSRRRAGPRRAERSEHAGPYCEVQRRGIKSARYSG
jgi:hypothetical protein